MVIDDFTGRAQRIRCERPLRIFRGGERLVRCRSCSACFRALRRYWAAAVSHEIQRAEARGCRTWLGTLTFRPSAARRLMQQVRSALGETHWDSLDPSARGSRVREEVLHEVQNYWKRLRKSGLTFRYFLAFETHGSGVPHVHWVLHETDPALPIRKRQLEMQWPHGFMGAKLVQSDSFNGTGRQRVAAYVTKALVLGKQARVCASQAYIPHKHAQGGGWKEVSNG